VKRLAATENVRGDVEWRFCSKISARLFAQAEDPLAAKNYFQFCDDLRLNSAFAGYGFYLGWRRAGRIAGRHSRDVGPRKNDSAITLILLEPAF
jgi:hypothetical protein